MFEVKIIEESSGTGGHYQSQSFLIGAPNQGWNELNITFPHNICLLAAEWNNKPEFDGDKIEFQVGPDTIVGALTAPAAVNDTVISVSQTVLDNIAVGYWAKVGSNDCGRVLAVDLDGGTITVETAIASAENAGSFVMQTIKILPESYLESYGREQLGESKIGGSEIPANMVLKARYFNSTASAKKMIFFLEYLY
jgi:hypothetical protein